ncbi:hypothetical protein DFP72DRAFT_845348 [Ephemerocybe angulata]|uniref:Ubiquitin-like domain-containing protein n=1 Tax=Ephemerocybe angulata TaxID=980116 RepID=A0A8H6M9H2_9AGAR|nr:hypothetical protein DFP72DRAFT_845348 [Tulosesus angulatus]
MTGTHKLRASLERVAITLDRGEISHLNWGRFGSQCESPSGSGYNGNRWLERPEEYETAPVTQLVRVHYSISVTPCALTEAFLATSTHLLKGVAAYSVHSPTLEDGKDIALHTSSKATVARLKQLISEEKHIAKNEIVLKQGKGGKPLQDSATLQSLNHQPNQPLFLTRVPKGRKTPGCAV